MNIYQSIPEKGKFKKPIVTIGNFDGVHCGHMKIFGEMIDFAKKNNGETVVVTFRKHPKNVLFAGSPMKILSDIDEKITAIKGTGIENLIVLDFNLEFSKMHAGEFINEILIEKIGAFCLVMGYDNAFGKSREGDLDFLLSFARSKGFEVIKIDPVLIDEHPVSSTWIRNELLDGNIERVNFLLGRNYSLSGLVVRGFGRGRSLGYPTANIDSEQMVKVVPGDGVYAVKVYLEDKVLSGMANIGKNPTFKNKTRSLEVNIFNFDEDIYDWKAKIKFFKKIREEISFDNIDNLINQLKIDKQAINDFFKDKNIKY